LRHLGLTVPRGVFIAGVGGLTDLHRHALTYPLVAKVSSSGIASKSELHGVRTNIKDEEALKKNVRELLRITDAEGVLIEEMEMQGVEVIVGGTIDRQFGPVVMFGLGGVFAELFRDVAFALAPLTRGDALWLIEQVKGRGLFDEYRGRPPVDKDALLHILIAVSDIIATGLVGEIDLNPVALYSKGAMILDAKMAVT
jgi:acetyl-CoA synthetase (ADP-forming)